jgi:hypothetical protein
VGGPPRNGHKAVLRVARPHGVEGSGMAGPGETLGNPWIPLAIRVCDQLVSVAQLLFLLVSQLSTHTHVATHVALGRDVGAGGEGFRLTFFSRQSVKITTFEGYK